MLGVSLVTQGCRVSTGFGSFGAFDIELIGTEPEETFEANRPKHSPSK